MLRILASFTLLSLLVACSGTSGNSVSAPVPKTDPQTAPQVETLSYTEGWKCVLFDANAETKDVFVARNESEDGFTLTLSDYEDELLSLKGLTLAGQGFRLFTFEKAATLSEKAVVTSSTGLPLPRIEGYLQGTIETGFELLSQELITDRNGNLIPTPTMDLLATIEDCSETRAAINPTSSQK